MRPNGLELCCPAEAGKPSWILRPTRRQSKRPRKPRPPGQLQRVVRRLEETPLPSQREEKP